MDALDPESGTHMYKLHIKRALVVLVIGLIAGILGSRFSPKVYEGRSEVVVADAAPAQNYSGKIQDPIDQILQGGQRQSPRSELEILRSTGVFQLALQNVATQVNDPLLVTEANLLRLYLMFDVQAAQNSTDNDPARVATIRARAFTPEVAASLANEVAKVYNEVRDRAQREAVSQAVTYSNEQLKASKALLESVEAKLLQARNKAGTTDIPTRAAQLLQLEAQALQQRDSLNAQLDGARAELAQMQRLLNTISKEALDSTSDQQGTLVAALESDLVSAQRDLDALRGQYTDSSTLVKEAQKRLQSVQSRLKVAKADAFRKVGSVFRTNPIFVDQQQRILAQQARLNGLVNQAASAEASAQRIRAQINQLPKLDAELQQLVRDRAVADLGYQKVSQRNEELKSMQQQGPRAAQILSVASPSSRAVAPVVERWAVLGALAGLALGLLYSFLVEFIRLPLHASGQLAELTQLPVAAVLPSLPRGHGDRRARALAAGSFPPSESIRFMAFSTLATADRPRLVLFTSITQDLGCSSAATEYATALARAGVKTTLVDLDLRRPTVTAYFKAEGKTGATELLERKVLSSEPIGVDGPTPGLRILPAGASNAVSISEYSNDQIEGFIGSLLDQSEVVVFDTAPCDVLADAARFSQFVDKVCLVVSAKRTSYRSIPTAQSILTKAGAKDIEIVLTDAQTSDEPFSARRSVPAQL